MFHIVNQTGQIPAIGVAHIYRIVGKAHDLPDNKCFSVVIGHKGLSTAPANVDSNRFQHVELPFTFSRNAGSSGFSRSVAPIPAKAFRL